MKKNILVYLFSMLTVISYAQTGSYQSADNSYYWKNRKPFEGYWQQDVYYKIDATLVDSNNVIIGNEELEYTNNSPDTLNKVYFHLYQNAFIQGAYLQNLNQANQFYQKFGKHEAAGLGTTLTMLMANNQVVQYSIDNTIVKVALNQPLLPNQTITFKIAFATYFDDGGNQRRRMKLFDAFGNKHFDGVHWYPRICVYDRKFGWETDQHLGKEFYGDFGTYEVTLNFPEHYVLDATGLLLNRHEVLPENLRKKLDIANFKDKPLNQPPSIIIPPSKNYKSWKFRAINVHDFAWTADPTYRIGEVKITLLNGNQVQCVALAQEPHAAKWQDAALFAARVIELYSKDFGMYAYPKMIVADARDGMEYPMLTLDGGLSPGYYSLFAHEIGHNWFFGMVGNNETYRASLDEGFTQFLTHWSMNKFFGETGNRKKSGYVAKHYNALPALDQTIYNGYIRDAINGVDMPLNTHSDDFNGALNHGGGYGNVYYKTATMLYNLQYVLGDSLFLAAMQHYFNQWKMCHPYVEDFRNSIIQYTHVDLNWFFDQWLETTKTIDYAIVGKASRVNSNNGQASDFYLVKLKRKGSMQMPIDLMAYSKSGKVFTTTISNTYFFKNNYPDSLLKLNNTWKGWGLLNKKYHAMVYCPGGLSKVSIDTTYRLADVNQLNNSTDYPLKVYFDGQVKSPITRRYYIAKWRPELWYNSVDGLKAGVHVNGNYFNYKHIFKATVWFNTSAGSQSNYSPYGLINYSFSYVNNLPVNFKYFLESRYLDGLYLQRLGFAKIVGKNTFELFFKSLYRNQNNYLDYLIYEQGWSNNQFNNSLNLSFTNQYKHKLGIGNVTVGMRSSALASDYSYASLNLQNINIINLGKLEWRTRLFMQWLTGDNIAPESKLNMASANNEELMENKFLRSKGFVPTAWMGYGNTINHLQQGGGLNLRGFAGYLLPVNTSTNQVYMFAGNSGFSINTELDFDQLFNFHPTALQQYFHTDIYAFADAGMLQNNFKQGEYGLQQELTINSDLLACAGLGLVFTIKQWGKLDEIKPFTIRFDMPLWVNRTPYEEGKFVNFRWVLGINRSF